MLLHVQHGLLGRLQHGIEAADDDHRQDDIAVLAADVDIAQDVIGDAPDEIGDPVQLALIHVSSRILRCAQNSSARACSLVDASITKRHSVA